jgi:hypothetical protein
VPGQKLKPIKDIRFFEHRGAGLSGFDHLGSQYPLVEPGEAGVLGARYAVLLASRGFQTPGFDHVYVTLRPDFPLNEPRAGRPALEPWMVQVDVGLPLAHWPPEAADQHCHLTVAATRALDFLAQKHGLDPSPLASCQSAMLEHGPSLELTRLTKATEAYTLEITYQARPFGVPSPVFARYHDHRSGRTRKAQVLLLDDWEDIFPLVARAAVSKGMIVLSPRESFRASLTTRAYTTPIRVPINQLLESCEPLT